MKYPKKLTYLILFLLSTAFINPISAQNNMVWTVDSLTFRALPFRGENNLYYTLFPGVISQDFRGNDLLHIRGSRHDEIAYYINDIDIRSDLTGMPLFRIIPQALASISIDKAPSVGISSARAAVTHVLRQGSDDYTFSINGETDKFTPLYEKRLDTYSYGYKNLTLTGGGTIPYSNTKFFIAGERESFDDRYRMFWDGFHITDNEMDLTFQTNHQYIEVDTGYIYTYDTINLNELTVKPGNIPKANSGRTTLNGVITQPFSNGSISFTALYEDETKRINNTPIYHLFNQARLPEINRKAQLYSLQGEYNFPMDFKLNLQADFLRSKQSTYDPNFGDDFLKYSDSTALVDKEIPYSNGWGMSLHRFEFQNPGWAIAGYSKQNEDFNNYMIDISKSFKNHKLKIGGEYKTSEFRFFNIGPNTMRYIQQYLKFYNYTLNTVPKGKLQEALNWGRVQGVGYNLLGEKITDESTYYDAPIQPKQASFYISDIITKGDWTAELGLRYDNLNNDMLYYKDSTAIDNTGNWMYLEEYKEGLIKQTRKSSWSPRINIKHNTSKNINSYFKLGKYTQFPQYKDIFLDKRYRTSYSLGSGIYNNDPRAWDAHFTTSHQSSYGLEYLLNNRINVNVELYSISTNNILQTGLKGLINTVYSSYPEYNEYSTLLSNGSSISRGLEITINYSDKNIDSWINYNYSKVKGTSTYPISNDGFTNPEYWWRDSIEYTPPQLNLDYNSQHSAVGFIAYNFSENENAFLKNTTINALGRFDSGHPYTLWEAGWDAGILYEGALPSHSSMRILHDPVYGNTTPWRLTVDLRIDKTIKLGKAGEMVIFAYTQNLLNKKNINHVHWKSGNTIDDGSAEHFEFQKENFEWFDDFYTLYELINLEHRQHYRDREGGDLFGRPREIRVGISFNY